MTSDDSLSVPLASLRREGAFLRSILHSLPHVSVLVTDTEPLGEVRFANRFFCDHNGVTPEQAVGMNAYDFASLPDDDRGAIDRAIDRALAGEGPVRVRAGFRPRGHREGSAPVKGLLLVSRLDCPDHAPKLLFVTIDLGGLGLADELDTMGNPLANAGWLSPAPEPRRRPDESDPAVAEARRERDFLKAILDNLRNIGVMVCDSEPVGEIRFANTFFCFHNAVTYEQAVTMNANTFASAPDDDMAKLYQAIGRAMAGEGPVSIHGYFRSKRQPYACWGLILVIRLDRPDASPCLIFATIALSELGLAVESSLMTGVQARAITTAARDGVALVDDQQRITYWNVTAEKLFGVIAVDAIGKGIADLLPVAGERETFRVALEGQLDLTRPSFEGGTFETVG
ncbi:MAG: PAS domain-containing protein, partial [Nitrospinae bacterium]|nr:PAS domain-containing protein [Nitrospinota bacterium]